MYQFKIDNLHCMSCFRNIEDALLEYDASIKAQVDIPTKTLSVETSQPIEKIKLVIQEAGYQAQEILRNI